MNFLENFGDDIGSLALLLIAIGILGGMIFGWGGWFTDGKSIWHESGCFSNILVISIIVMLAYIFLGARMLGTILILVALWYIIK